jgi:hypothetical protein
MVVDLAMLELARAMNFRLSIASVLSTRVLMLESSPCNLSWTVESGQSIHNIPQRNVLVYS